MEQRCPGSVPYLLPLPGVHGAANENGRVWAAGEHDPHGLKDRRGFELGSAGRVFLAQHITWPPRPTDGTRLKVVDGRKGPKHSDQMAGRSQGLEVSAAPGMSQVMLPTGCC